MATSKTITPDSGIKPARTFEPSEEDDALPVVMQLKDFLRECKREGVAGELPENWEGISAAHRKALEDFEIFVLKKTNKKPSDNAKDFIANISEFIFNDTKTSAPTGLSIHFGATVFVNNKTVPSSENVQVHAGYQTGRGYRCLVRFNLPSMTTGAIELVHTYRGHKFTEYVVFGKTTIYMHHILNKPTWGLVQPTILEEQYQKTEPKFKLNLEASNKSPSAFYVTHFRIQDIAKHTFDCTKLAFIARWCSQAVADNLKSKVSDCIKQDGDTESQVSIYFSNRDRMINDWGEGLQAHWLRIIKARDHVVKETLSSRQGLAPPLIIPVDPGFGDREAAIAEMAKKFEAMGNEEPEGGDPDELWGI